MLSLHSSRLKLLGNNRAAQLYICRSCRWFCQTLRRLAYRPERAGLLNLGGLGLWAINRVIGVRHKTVSCWIAEAAGNLPENRPETEASSLCRSWLTLHFYPEKKSECRIWVALHSSFAKTSGHLCGVAQPAQAENFSKNLRAELQWMLYPLAERP